MNVEMLQDKTIIDLKEIAKAMKLKGISKLRKDELVDLIINGNSEEKEIESLEKEKEKDDKIEVEVAKELPKEKLIKKTEAVEKKIEKDASKVYIGDKVFEKGSEEVEGVLEVIDQGYGFLRFKNFLTSELDVYISPSQIKKFSLRTGDKIKGVTRIPRSNERFRALLYVLNVNGLKPISNYRRPKFDNLTPLYPTERFELGKNSKEFSLRLIDFLAPIGKGQRGLIVAPPKAGKTMLLQKIAKSITENNKETEVIVLLIDERPEEVTEMERSINADVISSTFDELPSHHIKVAEMVLSRAKGLVEQKKDVVILLDSITRLARAYNLVIPSSGRTLSGGLDPAALHLPKRFFGAARNIEEGGSLTILATALIETGSRMDEVIFEEFKGTGNMEITLSRKLSEKRIFPAIDINKSSTRREELLLTQSELEAVWTIRRAIDNRNAYEITDYIISRILKSKTNEEFISLIKNGLK
ncbi:transcription termination factor Rho [Helicovermis profundi]|uniref:Transcription termination factor Rho n=2 Tax=Helicovermis profundi TaxID=3065157 RepID=A0AAU9EFI2_9FIRM|nr:transcription termination factor Rho [Clostridia bacterium S502]